MDALVVGEALVDVVTSAGGTAEHPGGSGANTAVALARLGRPVRLWTAYAADDRGAALETHLEAAGVRAAADPRLLGRTPTATARIDAHGAAGYEFDVGWRLGEVPDPALPQVIHLCSWAPVLEPGASAVAEFLSRTGATVTYDINLRPAVTGTGPVLTESVERAVNAATLVKASDEDLAVLYPELDLESAVGRLRGLGPDVVVVTRGSEGASWYGAEVVHVPSIPVAVVDTIGAGDTFSAGLLDALWDTEPATLDPTGIRAVLERAVRAAAVTVSRPGADPPTRAELG